MKTRVLNSKTFTLLALLPLATFALTPPALLYLNKQIDALDTQLQALNQHIETEQQKQQTTLAQTGQLGRRLVSLSRWPQPLIVLTSLTNDNGNAPQLLAHLRSQAAERLQKHESQLQTYLSLREQAAAKANQLTKLQQQFEDGTLKLSPDEKIAVLTAASSANTLALNIESALTPPLKTVATPTLEVETLLPATPNRQIPAQPAVKNVLPVVGKPRATTTGLLFNAANGAQVIAAAPGRVLYAGPFRQFGGLIIVETASRTQHIYAGLGVLNVQVGQTVEAKQTLGQLPDKGQVHLYWEVRKNGHPLPAAKLLSL